MPRRKSIGIVAFLAVLPIILSAAPALAVNSKYPDFESPWRNPDASQKVIPWDPAKPAGVGQQAPLTPEYQRIFEASLADQASGGQGNDYSGSCLLTGMPRMMSLVGPMQVLISRNITYMIFQDDLPRRIYTNGRDWPDEASTYQGYSIGKWIDENGDGQFDSLEVETRNFSGPRALESTGLPLHEDNETVVKERLHLDKANNDILHDEITTIDHAFTHPWTVTKTYVRDRHLKWKEYFCQKTKKSIRIGSQEYLLSAEGKLMPMRKGQRPPDLQYFK